MLLQGLLQLCTRPDCNASQLKVQDCLVRLQGIGFAEGGFGFGKTTRLKKCLAQRSVGHARLDFQKRRNGIGLDMQAIGVIEDLHHTTRLLGCLRVFARQAVELAQCVTHVQFCNLGLDHRFGIGIFGGVILLGREQAQQLFGTFDGPRDIAHLHPIVRKHLQGLFAGLFGIDSLGRIACREGILLVVDCAGDQRAAGRAGGGIEAVGTGEMPASPSIFAPLLQRPACRKMGKGREAILVDFRPLFAGRQGRG